MILVVAVPQGLGGLEFGTSGGGGFRNSAGCRVDRTVKRRPFSSRSQSEEEPGSRTLAAPPFTRWPGTSQGACLWGVCGGLEFRLCGWV